MGISICKFRFIITIFLLLVIFAQSCLGEDTKTAYTRDGVNFVSKARMDENIKYGYAEPGDYKQVEVPIDTIIVEASESFEETSNQYASTDVEQAQSSMQTPSVSYDEAITNENEDKTKKDTNFIEDLLNYIQQIRDYSIFPDLGELSAEASSVLLGLKIDIPWPFNTYAWKFFSYFGTALDTGEYLSGQSEAMYYHSFYKDGYDAGYDIGWEEGKADRLEGNEYAPAGIPQEYLINKPEIILRFHGKEDGYLKGYRDGYYWKEGLSISLQVTPNEISGLNKRNIIVRPLVKYNGKLIPDYECIVSGQTDVGSLYPEKSSVDNSLFGGKYASFEYRPSYGESKCGFIAFTAKLIVDGEEKDVSAIVPVTGEQEEELTSTVYTGGNVQVTLTWNSHADIDLYVEDPNQDVVWYRNPYVPSGGQLDRDNRCDDFTLGDPENIFWPASGAPSGRYKISVDYYEDCGNVGSVSWNVRQISGGKIENYNGVLQSVGDHQEVAVFEL